MGCTQLKIRPLFALVDTQVAKEQVLSQSLILPFSQQHFTYVNIALGFAAKMNFLPSLIFVGKTSPVGA